MYKVPNNKEILNAATRSANISNAGLVHGLSVPFHREQPNQKVEICNNTTHIIDWKLVTIVRSILLVCKHALTLEADILVSVATGGELLVLFSVSTGGKLLVLFSVSTGGGLLVINSTLSLICLGMLIE
jgi:hypothetical protein